VKAIEATQQRLGQKPDMVGIRLRTVEYGFGMLKLLMCAAHLLMKTREHVSIEASFHVLEYNLKRVMATPSAGAVMQACGTDRPASSLPR
jgi:hypothetical protein